MPLAATRCDVVVEGPPPLAGLPAAPSRREILNGQGGSSLTVVRRQRRALRVEVAAQHRAVPPFVSPICLPGPRWPLRAWAELVVRDGVCGVRQCCWQGLDLLAAALTQHEVPALDVLPQVGLPCRYPLLLQRDRPCQENNHTG